MPGIAARRRVTAGARVAVTATSVRARSATPAVEILLAVELPILTPTELAILLPILATTELAILLPVLAPTELAILLPVLTAIDLAILLPVLTPTNLAILLPVLAPTELAILLPVLTPTRRQYGEIGIGTRRGREGVGSHRDRACRHDRRQHADEGKCATQKPCA